ncbi:MAG: isoprenylcysteine carboxylmethyltransferase family protein [bacterium]|nr:isoprenylcysteine carboxylmethyltransferase family protein [bacterium]
MVESILVTLPALLFLIVLFGGGEQFRRKNINMDGDPPIHRGLFYFSKYSIVILWVSMAVHAWGCNLSCFPVPGLLKPVALCAWFAGFSLLFMGRFGLGSSFRIGSPQESTNLKMDGLFRVSRNPMYVGVYLTLTGTVLYTLNPILLLVAAFIIAVHHKIVLAEEQYLAGAFGAEYADYCHRVRRYL